MNTTLCRVLGSIVLMSLVGSPAALRAQSDLDSADSMASERLEAEELQPRDSGAAELLARAAQLRASHEANPGAPDAKEARRQEAVALLQAGFAGDETQKSRREGLVQEMLADTSLDAASRCEIAAYAGNLEVHRNAILTTDQRLDEYERVARGLARDFPDVQANYDALLRIAQSRPAGEGLSLARELTTMPAAPLLKMRAEQHAARCELIGERLVEICRNAVEAENPFEGADGIVIVYSWSEAVPESIQTAKQIATLASANATIFGLNLDPDLQRAKEVARRETPPGRQIFATLGSGGALCEALHLSEPGLIYTTDEAGEIVSISAQEAWVRFVTRRPTP